MLARELLGTAQVPGGEELRLYSHGRDFMIVLDRNELMSTPHARVGGSTGGHEPGAAGECARPALLIGGYGMGFTLRAALKNAPANARVTVVEMVPEIIEWAKGRWRQLTGDTFDDPRFTLRMGDVADAIADGPAAMTRSCSTWTTGPTGWCAPENDRIYSNAGLAAARRALTPEGVLAIWSAAPDPRFTKQLERARFIVDPVEVSARMTRTARARGRSIHLVLPASLTGVEGRLHRLTFQPFKWRKELMRILALSLL